MMAETAENHRAHAARMRLGKKGGDPRAHRIAHHIGRLDMKMIEKGAGILRHFLHGIVSGIIQFFAASMPAIIKGDDPAPRPGQDSYPLRKDPIHRMLRSEPMNEKDRFAALARHRALVDKGQANALIGEFAHLRSHLATI